MGLSVARRRRRRAEKAEIRRGGTGISAAEAAYGEPPTADASDPVRDRLTLTDQATELLVVGATRAWAAWDDHPSREGLAANLAVCDRALGELVGLSGVQVRVRLCDWRRAGLGYETCVRLLLARRST